MAGTKDLIQTDIEKYLNIHETKDMLQLITCGSVDDGKSTLIGRLLFESQALTEDQLANAATDSKKHGTQGDNLDLALLVDGLAAEREQGITIDVAYRYFHTDQRKFILTDAPGHEQYTRNMITGASNADAAIILVDARNGVQIQTKRHTYLASLIGIRSAVLVINKMDLVDYSESTFEKISEEFKEFSDQLDIENITTIPVSALLGDNITERGTNMPWYHGSTLLSLLETLQIDQEAALNKPFRLPVQWVNRPNLDFRGFAGTVASGSIKVGDPVRVQPSGKTTSVARIVTKDGDLETAVAHQAITLILNDEIDISRGDITVSYTHLTLPTIYSV